jgi:site-specific DNA-adenine methylase
MNKEIIEISKLFINESKDKDELIKLIEVVGSKERWMKSKAYFSEVRHKNLKNSKDDKELQALYAYIESCYKSLYNLTHPTAPFDADSPFKIIQNALRYCKHISIQEAEIMKILG